MIYVMTSKDGIFYEKIRLEDTSELTTEQVEVDKETWLNTPLPCKLISGEFVETDEYPMLELPAVEPIDEPPSRLDVIEAQLYYLSMMTNNLSEV